MTIDVLPIAGYGESAHADQRRHPVPASPVGPAAALPSLAGFGADVTEPPRERLVTLMRQSRARTLLLAALLALPVAIAPSWSANAAPIPGDPDLGEPTVAATDVGGVSAGEERTAALAVTYGQPRVEVRRPGAAYVKVHFTSLRLVPGDYVTVADPARREVHTYRGDPTRGEARPGDSGYTIHRTRGFAAMSVDGDTAIVTLHAVGARSATLDRRGFGARIDRFWRGYDAAEIAANTIGTQAVCGTDARRDVVCYRNSHPTEFARANAVARLLRDGRGFCTGWRVGNTNRLLTNNHCVSSASGIRATEVQFEFQCATCGGNNPLPGTKVGGAELLRTSGSLDYTLFSVNNFSSIQRFGTLFLDVRSARQGERIYIPGHGDVKPKRLSIFETEQNGPVCTVRNPDRGVDIAYNCDTSGGNSGSPVLAGSSHRVIALHHTGRCPSNNGGVKIDLIYREIASLIDNRG
ncbi:MAG TPA: serine protease [Pilimelia sp.]|nr:serine protease [Pilimelia sp.]